ncbi:MAG: hypothetical protein ACJAUD_002263 [Crocinitomicaceae bacterium]|jgi:hypothetical protein
MRIFVLAAFLLLVKSAQGQTESICVNDFEFEIKTDIAANEWGTFDTINRLYRIENVKETYLLKYYTFKDNGGDCNNLFWYKEQLEIENDRLIFSTNYFQLTNIDPIPVERKQIYQVQNTGEVLSVFDKYRYRDRSEWVEN